MVDALLLLLIPTYPLLRMYVVHVRMVSEMHRTLTLRMKTSVSESSSSLSF